MIATSTGAATRIAVVRAADGIRFRASAAADEELAAKLVSYIAERCDDVLWPDDAREVRRLIADQRMDDAIEAYFTTVGRRWDDEWLERRAASR